MSGPKCIEIRLDPRVAERERNRSQCAVLGAEYERLEAELRHLNPELKKIGLDGPGVTSNVEIDRNVTHYLNEDRDREAVDYLRRESQRLRATMIHIQQKINDAHVQMVASTLRSYAGPVQSLDELLTSLTKTPTIEHEQDQTEKKLNLMLARLAVLKDTVGWAALAEKAREIRAESNRDRRQMLCADLTIRCSQRLKHLRELRNWEAEIDQLIESVAQVRGAAAIGKLVSELKALKRSGRLEQLDSERHRVKEALEQEGRRLERERKRQAILNSLHELGYETSEGMETALVRGGQLIIRKPDDKEYAIEVAANDELSLLQTTVLRYADSSDTSQQQRLRDTAREETWCHDHEKLLEALAKSGLTTNFKMKRKPGEIPMRVVIDKAKVEARRRAAARLSRSQSSRADGG